MPIKLIQLTERDAKTFASYAAILRIRHKREISDAALLGGIVGWFLACNARYLEGLEALHRAKRTFEKFDIMDDYEWIFRGIDAGE